MIKQLTIFVENKQGKIVDITRTLAKHDINLRALSIAETEEFGILRLIVNDVENAERILKEEGYLIKITEVVGVKINDEPGRLAEALAVLDKEKINLEYLYAFMLRTEKHAYVVLRVEDNAYAEESLKQAGFKIVTEADVNKL